MSDDTDIDTKKLEVKAALVTAHTRYMEAKIEAANAKIEFEKAQARLEAFLKITGDSTSEK